MALFGRSEELKSESSATFDRSTPSGWEKPLAAPVAKQPFIALAWTGRLLMVDESLVLRIFGRLLADDSLMHAMQNDRFLEPLAALVSQPAFLPSDLNPAFVARALLYGSDVNEAIPFVERVDARAGDVVRLQGRVCRVAAVPDGLQLTVRAAERDYAVRVRQSALNGAPLRGLTGEPVVVLGIMEVARRRELVGAALMVQTFANGR